MTNTRQAGEAAVTARRLYLELLQNDRRPEAAFELRQLFIHRTGWDAGIPWSAESMLDESDEMWLSNAAASIAEGYPLQYVLGLWEFYGLPLKVGPGVLIPRPDTETVVRAALEMLRCKAKPRIADLCAGSGAIGIALAKNHSGLKCWSVELSEKAMRYLMENITLNGLEERVTPVIADATGHMELPILDMVVSNPPYLSCNEMEALPPNVAQEPTIALCGGADGLEFYRAISRSAKILLQDGGALLFEVGYTQAEDVACIMERSGYTALDIMRDYTGVHRCVRGLWRGGH